MKKLILPVIAITISFLCGMGIENQRQRDTEYEALVKIADMQAVKIAIVEQASKLQNYTRQLKAAQETKKNDR